MLPEEAGVTDLSEEERVEQIVLEKLMSHVHEEIPYKAEVVCNSVEHGINSIICRVDVTLDSTRHRKVVIGHQGRTMLKIRQAACQDLEEIFKQTTLIQFDFKVRKKSSETQEQMI